MKRFALIAAAAAAVLATGCSEPTGTTTPENEAGAIEFRTLVDKGTRASLVSNYGDLNSIFISATAGDDEGQAARVPAKFNFMEAAAYKDKSVDAFNVEHIFWTYAPKRYLPSNGDRVDFFAYAPIKDPRMTEFKPALGNTANFTYTLPNDQRVANNSTDLMVAASGIGQHSTNGATVLDFHHALSAVSFFAANTNDHETQGELTYVVEQIRISKLYTEALFTFPAPAAWDVDFPNAWSNYALQNDFVAGVPDAGVALVSEEIPVRKNLLSANDVMMVIPQAPTLGTLDIDGNVDVDGSFVEVMYSLKDGSGAVIIDSETRLFPLPEDFVFQPGSKYNFAFDFSTDEEELVEITFDVTYNEWVAEDDGDDDGHILIPEEE